jgi:hypothetical protein
MPSAFVPCGRHGRKRVLVAKCGKGSLLREVEPFERAIGRVHGRRLLCVGWQNKRMVVGAFCRGVQVNYRAASGAASKSLKEKPHAASREESDPTRLNALTIERPYSIAPKANLCQQLAAPAQHHARDEGGQPVPNRSPASSTRWRHSGEKNSCAARRGGLAGRRATVALTMPGRLTAFKR